MRITPTSDRGERRLGRPSHPLPGVCRFVLEPDLRTEVFKRLKAKYGIHWYMSLWGSLLTGRVPHRLVLEFAIPEDAKPL